MRYVRTGAIAEDKARARATATGYRQDDGDSFDPVHVGATRY